MTLRKIIHIDMDAFYASVEMRDDPSLVLKPIAVGGDPDKRGVIATANYLARKFGIRSAMPSWKAKQLCPDLIILYPDFDKYKRESKAIHEIFHLFTDLIEPLSLDEAFLDVTDVDALRGSATWIAQEIRQLIWKERGLTASAGVAPNKFLAKVASDWHKPNGQFVLTPKEVDAFMAHLPVEKIFGIGHVMAKKLHNLGLMNCGDLQTLDMTTLQKLFGSRAWNLYELCRGIDHRFVISDRIRKSLSVESTFLEDLNNLELCYQEIPNLIERLMIRYEKISNQYYKKKPFIKIKFADFTTTTVENTFFKAFDLETYQTLIRIGWERKKAPVRLLGLGMSLSLEEEIQLTLF
ncbi:DNA polymerase IV [Candidatus Protochlamydia amoebophila]|uniref:DNA polymerase IV n=1 Tax=Candidatus Protochlamydia amoebophila TaxID=362787 RepID=UPI001BC8FE05|nr:DNA polymerase IV [Candidatus Protochlamydia amoebophila]MBS4164800.1 DNA polymerase IV [Candidatus Protochlamydia amoebophila]